MQFFPPTPALNSCLDAIDQNNASQSFPITCHFVHRLQTRQCQFSWFSSRLESQLTSQLPLKHKHLISAQCSCVKIKSKITHIPSHPIKQKDALHFQSFIRAPDCQGLQHKYQKLLFFFFFSNLYC